MDGARAAAECSVRGARVCVERRCMFSAYACATRDVRCPGELWVPRYQECLCNTCVSVGCTCVFGVQRVHSSCSAARVQHTCEPSLRVCARMYMHWTWLCVYVHVHTCIAHGCAFMHIYIAHGCACMHTYMHCTWLCVCSTLDVHSMLQWGKAVQTGSSAGVRRGLQLVVSPFARSHWGQVGGHKCGTHRPSTFRPGRKVFWVLFVSGNSLTRQVKNEV